MDDKSLRKIVDLDLLIHTPARLAVLMFLLPRFKATFPEVITALDLTSGNLSSHVKKLEEAELILVEKAFIESKPTTILILTEAGRQAVLSYADVLKSALEKIS
ncbi:MAG: transcriptional regulator [Candidatus Kariarchaeaceae archaeon]